MADAEMRRRLDGLRDRLAQALNAWPSPWMRNRSTASRNCLPVNGWHPRGRDRSAARDDDSQVPNRPVDRAGWVLLHAALVVMQN